MLTAISVSHSHLCRTTCIGTFAIPLLGVFKIFQNYMSYGLNSLKGGLYKGIVWGTTVGVIKGDTRSLD